MYSSLVLEFFCECLLSFASFYTIYSAVHKNESKVLHNTEITDDLLFSIISRLNTLCTSLVWMIIAAIATLYTSSGYIIGPCCSAMYEIWILPLLQCTKLYPAVKSGSEILHTPLVENQRN